MITSCYLHIVFPKLGLFESYISSLLPISTISAYYPD